MRCSHQASLRLRLLQSFWHGRLGKERFRERQAAAADAAKHIKAQSGICCLILAKLRCMSSVHCAVSGRPSASSE